MTYTPYTIEGENRDSRFLITCDHASNHVPDTVAGGDLGLPAADMGRHIAYDIGSAGVARHLGTLLDAPVVLSNFSRLVIDPNRGEEDPTLVMKLYDGTIVPANRKVDEAEVERRKDLFYRPYDAVLERMAARRDDVIYVAVHSFTPRLNGRRPRPWHVGILHAWDERFSRPFLNRLQAEPDMIVGENEPYPGHLPGDAVDRHALRHGRPNALIELRHDLIDTIEGQRDWAERLAPLLDAARKDMDGAVPHRAF
ncbi:MAG: N-formylglutamate amidohydrolase [Paracoccaceae bacterium]|nr:N-formylglutamate amidohydrolase [Paracoccaceae bacterium]